MMIPLSLTGTLAGASHCKQDPTKGNIQEMFVFNSSNEPPTQELPSHFGLANLAYGDSNWHPTGLQVQKPVQHKDGNALPRDSEGAKTGQMQEWGKEHDEVDFGQRKRSRSQKKGQQQGEQWGMKDTGVPLHLLPPGARGRRHQQLRTLPGMWWRSRKPIPGFAPQSEQLEREQGRKGTRRTWRLCGGTTDCELQETDRESPETASSSR